MHVLITGASDGIGAATARAFAREGASVGLVARRGELLAQIAGEIRAAGGHAGFAVADVGVREQLDAALKTLVRELGPVGVLVNNAGMPGGAGFAALPFEQIERVTTVNLLAPLWATHAVLPSMLARGQGTIVNVASIAGRIGVPGASVYSATKFGLAGFTDALAFELSPRGVAVVLVNPGPIRTTSWPHRGVPSPLVLEADAVATAIVRAVDRGTPERTIPRYYRIAALTRSVAPPLYRAMLRRFAASRRSVES